MVHSKTLWPGIPIPNDRRWSISRFFRTTPKGRCPATLEPDDDSDPNDHLRESMILHKNRWLKSGASWTSAPQPGGHL